MTWFMGVIYDIFMKFDSVSPMDIMSSKPNCRCLLCGTPLKDTNELTEYIQKLEDVIDKQKEILSSIQDLPEDTLPRICKDFEVKRAEASNKRKQSEAQNERKLSHGDFRAR